MKTAEMKPGIHCVGANDWDRRLFDALIPIPYGTSYNSYLIKGSEKTALVDTVDPAMWDVLNENLNRLGVEKIDYVIANHAEQDHAGSLPYILEKYPEATLICSPRCKGMLIDHLMVPEERIITVPDRENISLGDRTLEFIHAPWVHWPETMLTYLKEDKILFPCDFFGSHLATDDMYVTDEPKTIHIAKTYYAEIMMPYRTTIEKNMLKLKEYDIEIIAPSHGPAFDKPESILDSYHHWVFDDPENIVMIPYISMHGSTRKMVEYFIEALEKRDVRVKRFNLAAPELAELAVALVDAATIVIGTPTVLAGPHPNAVYAAFLANALRPKLKFASIIGSYGWGGRTVDVLATTIPNLKVEILDPVLAKGYPKEADYQALDNLAGTIAEKHKELNLK